MDPHTSNPNSPNGSGEWLPRYTLDALHRLLEKMGQVIADCRNLSTDLVDLKTQLSSMHDRLIKIEAAQAPQSEVKSGLVNSLFGSVGGWIVSHLPWKHAALMGLGAAGALFGHVMPDRVKNAGVGLVKILTDLFSG